MPHPKVGMVVIKMRLTQALSLLTIMRMRPSKRKGTQMARPMRALTNFFHQASVLGTFPLIMPGVYFSWRRNPKKAPNMKAAGPKSERLLA